MRIIRFLTNGGTEAVYGVQPAEGAAEAEVLDVASGIDPMTGIRSQLMPEDFKLSGKKAKIEKLLAPIQPVNLFCIGLNYKEHAVESQMPFPARPVVFMKPTSTACAHGDEILIPACEQKFIGAKGDVAPDSVEIGETDYECELAIIIGKACKNVSEADALKYVLGYTCCNDVSAREWQFRAGAGQWIKGKSFDTFAPLGPCMTTSDEITDPQTLPIKTHLNGKTVQNHTTGDMIFTCAQIVSYLSQDLTLLPGTVIITGTPQGVGFAMKPCLWLRDGDSVTIEIGSIGSLTNKCVKAK
jgi:2-keto-4-pentenoate hydratase/2-oxohepta-3-ene-1,7-dioic acid hydratase in catechol pathway